eukprot:gene16797-19148_t
MIKIHTVSGKSVEGEVFAIDPVTKSVVLKVEGNYVVFNPTHIARIEGDISSVRAPAVGELGINIAGIEKRELAAQKQAEKALAAVNHSVNSDVQNLFDKFNIIYENTKWNNTDIIILGEYAITAPYTEVKVLPGKDGKALDRLTKILEGERKKWKSDA